MKRKTETIVLVLIIAALTAYLLWKRTEDTRYRLPRFSEVAKEEITHLTIRKSDAEMTLRRDGERWRILPEEYPADGAAVDRMLEAIGGVRLTALASASENYAVYDLDEEDRVQVSAFNGEDLLLSLGVGKTAPSHRHTFVKLADDPRVYHAESNLRSAFDKGVSALRDKQVLKIDEEVSEIVLASGGKSLHILRAPAQAGEDAAGEQGAETGARSWETLEGKPVQEKEIDGLVKTLSDLKCDGYLEEGKDALGDPAFTVSLKGVKNYELSLFDEREGKTAATSSENEHVFLISEWKAKKIRKDLDSLTETEE